MATRTRRRELQRAFVTTVAVASAALLPACSGSVDVQPTPNPTTCPATQPAAGTPCGAAMECQYNDSCSESYECVAGAWVDTSPSCNPPFPEPCPAEAPPLGSSCFDPSLQTCLYPNWDECGQDLNVSCNGGVWVAENIGSCNPPPPCPAEAPESGSFCDFPVECPYTVDSPCGPVAAIASCDGATWTVDSILCNPPPPDPCKSFALLADCVADPSCRWLVPGCGMPSLAQEGCFPALDCTDGSCPPGESCQTVSTQCADCQTCDFPVLICLPAGPGE